MKLGKLGLVSLLLASCGLAQAASSVAVLKSVQGDVRVQRAGSSQPARLGMQLQQADRLFTGRDSSAGISFRDGSLLSVGADADLNVDVFRFNSTTHDGAFETTLAKGKLAVVSGKIAKHKADAMKVRTPSTTLGVRGTEFLVDASP